MGGVVSQISIGQKSCTLEAMRTRPSPGKGAKGAKGADEIAAPVTVRHFDVHNAAGPNEKARATSTVGNWACAWL